jgi:hypothetical protein
MAQAGWGSQLDKLERLLASEHDPLRG